MHTQQKLTFSDFSKLKHQIAIMLLQLPNELLKFHVNFARHFESDIVDDKDAIIRV